MGKTRRSCRALPGQVLTHSGSVRGTGSRPLIISTFFVRSLYAMRKPDQRYHQYEQNGGGQEYVIDTHRECLLTDQAIYQRQALGVTQPLGAQLR